MDAEKVTISAYVIMHLTMTDFVVGFVGALIRVLANYSKAKQKVKALGTAFDNGLYFSDNWDKILYGMSAGLGLLFIVPEAVIHGGELFFGKTMDWNSGFSGIIGLAGVEVVEGIIRRTKLKLSDKEAAHEPIT